MAFVRVRSSAVALAGAGGAPGGTTRILDSKQTSVEASAAEATKVPTLLVVVVIVGVLLVWFVMFVLNPFSYVPATAAVLAAGASTFALLYVAAQALERLLEPFASLDGRYENLKATYEKALQAAENATGADQEHAAEAAAKNKAALESWREGRAILLWGVATVAGMAASAITGIYLLDIVVDSPAPSRAFDILVTGLVVGGGTKPLHDLISRLEKAKETAEDPATA